MLLRALHGLSEVGNTLDDLVEPFPILPAVRLPFPSTTLQALVNASSLYSLLIVVGPLPESETLGEGVASTAGCILCARW